MKKKHEIIISYTNSALRFDLQKSNFVSFTFIQMTTVQINLFKLTSSFFRFCSIVFLVVENVLSTCVVHPVWSRTL